MVVGPRTKSANELRAVISYCTDCSVCRAGCVFLEKRIASPLQVALVEDQETKARLAYSCLLCGLCDAVCPLQLRPSAMFREIRKDAVSRGSNLPQMSRLFFTDRKYNLYSLYRSAHSIDYSDLRKKRAKAILFPGCALGTFHPTLTRELYKNLAKDEPDLSIFDGCCYKPLEDLGLEDRFDKAIQGLNDSLDDMGVERVITACPTCLRNLQRDLKGRNVVSCYDLVKPVEPVRNGVKLVTVHDSCSDRETGTIGSAVRGVLSRYYSLVEMEHNRSNALCCGSGGLVSAYDPELAVEASRRRMDEAASTKADVVVTYCANCSNALSSQNRKNVEVRHSLELLLNVREDYNQVQDNIRNLLNGPKKELIGKLLESSA